jgi:Fe-S-cluster containining protein
MHICAHCATVQKTCCQHDAIDILVTGGDLRRIISYLEDKSHNISDFYELRSPKAEFFDPTDANWYRYIERGNGTRQYLKKTPQGDCIFLTSTGCELDAASRPLICRLYPYYYTENGLEECDPFLCPGECKCMGEHIFKELEMDKSTAEIWRQTLYRELKEDYDSRNI